MAVEVTLRPVPLSEDRLSKGRGGADVVVLERRGIRLGRKIKRRFEFRPRAWRLACTSAGMAS